MRSKMMILLSIFVLAALNYGVYKKEQIIKNGQILMLELAPVDPRSLMQGDYMSLRYTIEREAPIKELASHQKRGYMVVRRDENNVAQFVRFHNNENIEPEEKLLHFHKKYGRLRIVPDSFFFQEGHAKFFENSKYGVFKFDNSGHPLLVGLANENRETIVIP